MFSNRGRGTNLGVLLLGYQLLTMNDNLPPVTLAAILFQAAVFLGFVPQMGAWKTGELCLLPARIWYRGEWPRLIASTFMHGSDMHLYYNMASFMWKGRRLERMMCSFRFLVLLCVFAISTSLTMVGLSLLVDEYLDFGSWGLMQQCAVGFSGVLFALKVLCNEYFPYEDSMLLGWLPFPSRYACWAELALIQVLVPNASFVGHLAGILVGLAYVHGPLKYIINTVSSIFGLRHAIPGRYSGAEWTRRDHTVGGGYGNNYQSYGYPNYGNQNEYRYERYTGGLSEEEQIRRAMEESRFQYRGGRNGPFPTAPPYPMG